MSIIENLLLNINEKSEIKPSKNHKSNFLLDLLNSFKNDTAKLTDLLKNLNIDEKDLDKFFDKELTSDLKDLINKIKISLKTKKDDYLTKENQPINHETQKNDDKHNISDILKILINTEPVSNNELEKKVNELIKNEIKTVSKHQAPEIQPLQIPQIKTDIEKELVKFTKKIITSQKTLNKLKLTEKEINKFKEIKTFKKLVEFANEKKLNISKIILSYKKTKNISAFIKPQLPKNKIELKNNDKNSTLPKVTKNEKSSQKKLLSSLLQKTEKNSISNTNNKKSNLNTQQKKEIKSESLTPNVTEKTEQIEIKSSNKFRDKTQIKENSIKTSDLDSNIHQSTAQNIIQNLKQNIHKAKESIKHFATGLKEAIENYKPPVSKLSMELHPKELGKVEVTIVHRGDNLQIQINSNNTAVGFMHSQQQELRQNLINMGFTDVNMSFNQNQQQGRKEYRQNQKFSNNSNEENDELIIEIPYQYA